MVHFSVNLGFGFALQQLPILERGTWTVVKGRWFVFVLLLMFISQLEDQFSPSDWQADFHHKLTWTTQEQMAQKTTTQPLSDILAVNSSPILSRHRQTCALKTNQQTNYCLPTTLVFQLTKLVISLFWLHWKVKYVIVFERFGRICLWTGSKSCVSHSVKTSTLYSSSSRCSVSIAGSCPSCPSAGPSAPWLRAHTLRASLESPAKLMLGRFGCKRKVENLEKTDPQSSPKPSALPESACELVHSPQHESKLSHMHRRCGLRRFEAHVSVRSVMGWRILGAVVVYHCHVDTASSTLLVFFPHVRVPVLDSLPRILPTFEVQLWVAAR